MCHHTNPMRWTPVWHRRWVNTAASSHVCAHIEQQRSTMCTHHSLWSMQSQYDSDASTMSRATLLLYLSQSERWYPTAVWVYMPDVPYAQRKKCPRTLDRLNSRRQYNSNVSITTNRSKAATAFGVGSSSMCNVPLKSIRMALSFVFVPFTAVIARPKWTPECASNEKWNCWIFLFGFMKIQFCAAVWVSHKHKHESIVWHNVILLCNCDIRNGRQFDIA